MYQTRSEVSRKLPIPRKGTKYVARARSHIQDSVPIVVALRDMLKLARTSREVKKMINKKLLKINGTEVKDHRDSIKLFNILHADKDYLLTLKSTGRFALEETKEKNRACRIINKKVLKGKSVQLNLHDGSNILSDDKVKVYDTVYLDFNGKISKHVSFEKGSECIVLSGKYLGHKGKITSITDGKVKVTIKDTEDTPILKKESIMIL